MLEKFLLLGGTGYVGQAFQTELARRGCDYINVSRQSMDYTNFGALRKLLADCRPTFLINCAGYTGKPNVDACELDRAGTILGNVLLPETIANACEAAGVPWGQVSSGCIYAGAKVSVPGQPVRIERDLMLPAVRALWQADASVLQGFTEEDEPNFSFRQAPCSFYSGTKALGEELLAGREANYLWRLRIPFDNQDSPRNYLSKIQNYARVYDNVNSLSHRSDYAKACLDLWERRAPFGTYNVTNPGWVTTRQVAELLRQKLQVAREFDYFVDDQDFYSAANAPRSNTILDTKKLLAAGIQIRTVETALEESLVEWQSLKDPRAIRPPHFTTPTPQKASS